LSKPPVTGGAVRVDAGGVLFVDGALAHDVSRHRHLVTVTRYGAGRRSFATNGCVALHWIAISRSDHGANAGSRNGVGTASSTDNTTADVQAIARGPRLILRWEAPAAWRDRAGGHSPGRLAGLLASRLHSSSRARLASAQCIVRRARPSVADLRRLPESAASGPPRRRWMSRLLQVRSTTRHWISAACRWCCRCRRSG
jgi:hypothetical protein